MKILAEINKKGFLASADLAMAVDGLYDLIEEMNSIKLERIEINDIMNRNWQEKLEIDTFQALDFYIKEFDFEQYDLVLAGVTECRKVLRKMNCLLNHVETYPKKLKRYLGREIKSIKLKEVFDNRKEKIFIKPVIPKLFQAVIVENSEDLVSLLHINEEVEIYTSEIVNFETEWRCYIHHNELIGMYYYSGDWIIRPDIGIVEEMIKENDGPVSYVLDVGVIDGKTYLVEANDFYSIGNYGLNFRKYAEMLLNRWKELTNSH